MGLIGLRVKYHSIMENDIGRTLKMKSVLEIIQEFIGLMG